MNFSQGWSRSKDAASTAHIENQLAHSLAPDQGRFLASSQPSSQQLNQQQQQQQQQLQPAAPKLIHGSSIDYQERKKRLRLLPPSPPPALNPFNAHTVNALEGMFERVMGIANASSRSASKPLVPSHQLHQYHQPTDHNKPHERDTIASPRSFGLLKSPSIMTTPSTSLSYRKPQTHSRSIWPKLLESEPSNSTAATASSSAYHYMLPPLDTSPENGPRKEAVEHQHEEAPHPRATIPHHEVAPSVIEPPRTTESSHDALPVRGMERSSMLKRERSPEPAADMSDDEVVELLSSDDELEYDDDEQPEKVYEDYGDDDEYEQEEEEEEEEDVDEEDYQEDEEDDVDYELRSDMVEEYDDRADSTPGYGRMRHPPSGVVDLDDSDEEQDSDAFRIQEPHGDDESGAEEDQGAQEESYDEEQEEEVEEEEDDEADELDEAEEGDQDVEEDLLRRQRNAQNRMWRPPMGYPRPFPAAHELGATLDQPHGFHTSVEKLTDLISSYQEGEDEAEAETVQEDERCIDEAEAADEERDLDAEGDEPRSDFSDAEPKIWETTLEDRHLDERDGSPESQASAGPSSDDVVLLLDSDDEDAGEDQAAEYVSPGGGQYEEGQSQHEDDEDVQEGFEHDSAIDLESDQPEDDTIHGEDGEQVHDHSDAGLDLEGTQESEPMEVLSTEEVAAVELPMAERAVPVGEEAVEEQNHGMDVDSPGMVLLVTENIRTQTGFSIFGQHLQEQQQIHHDQHGSHIMYGVDEPVTTDSSVQEHIPFSSPLITDHATGSSLQEVVQQPQVPSDFDPSMTHELVHASIDTLMPEFIERPTELSAATEITESVPLSFQATAVSPADAASVAADLEHASLLERLRAVAQEEKIILPTRELSPDMDLDQFPLAFAPINITQPIGAPEGSPVPRRSKLSRSRTMAETVRDGKAFLEHSELKSSPKSRNSHQQQQQQQHSQQPASDGTEPLEDELVSPVLSRSGSAVDVMEGQPSSDPTAPAASTPRHRGEVRLLVQEARAFCSGVPGSARAGSSLGTTISTPTSSASSAPVLQSANSPSRRPLIVDTVNPLSPRAQGYGSSPSRGFARRRFSLDNETDPVLSSSSDLSAPSTPSAASTAGFAFLVHSGVVDLAAENVIQSTVVGNHALRPFINSPQPVGLGLSSGSGGGSQTGSRSNSQEPTVVSSPSVISSPSAVPKTQQQQGATGFFGFGQTPFGSSANGRSGSSNTTSNPFILPSVGFGFGMSFVTVPREQSTTGISSSISAVSPLPEKSAPGINVGLMTEDALGGEAEDVEDNVAEGEDDVEEEEEEEEEENEHVSEDDQVALENDGDSSNVHLSLEATPQSSTIMVLAPKKKRSQSKTKAKNVKRREILKLRKQQQQQQQNTDQDNIPTN